MSGLSRNMTLAELPDWILTREDDSIMPRSTIKHTKVE